ncbi:hypothetical protein P261_00413 [Lachnospiraceae bacterium TWA4]|nr:hypothetical protein P261_00413 [Lachnospiraceae bacterium TWA4]
MKALKRILLGNGISLFGCVLICSGFGLEVVGLAVSFVGLCLSLFAYFFRSEKDKYHEGKEYYEIDEHDEQNEHYEIDEHDEYCEGDKHSEENK